MHRRPCFTPPGRGRLRRPWVIYRGIRQRSPIRRDREVIYRESRPGQMRGALRHRPGRRWGPSAGGRMRDFRRVSAQATRSGRRGDRSWPSQSEAGAARTRFPRRPRRVTASRETWHFERTTASRELQCPSAAFHKRAQIRCYRPMFAIDSLISPMLYRLPKATISPDLPAICIATRKPSSMLPAM